MLLKEIYNRADGIAPFALSQEFITRYGYRDNSGIMLDCGEDVKGVLVSLDLSSRTVEEAVNRGANCIFTHHPGIWDAVMRISEQGNNQNLLACVQKRISVLSSHLSLDAAEGGIDDSLMYGLGGKQPLAVMEELTGGGYGKVYDIPATPLPIFCNQIKLHFETKRLLSYGEHAVRRVASFCGAGFGYDAINFALRNGADTLVSSDAKHHLIAEAVERGLNVVLLTHYAAEVYGMRRFAERLAKELSVPVTFFADQRLM